MVLWNSDWAGVLGLPFRQIAIGSKVLDLCSLLEFTLTLLEHGTRDHISSTGVKQLPDAVQGFLFEWLL